VKSIAPRRISSALGEAQARPEDFNVL